MQLLQASAAGHEFGLTCAPDGLGAMRVRPRLSQALSDGAHAVAAVVAAGPAGSRGWAHSFSAASFRILKRGGVALKAGSRALPVTALRPRPKYVLFDCYAGAHSCLAAMEHRCATRRSALRGTLVCLSTLGLLECRHTRFASMSRHARPGHSLLAARAAAMATAEQLRSLYRQAMPVGYACAQCVCPSWRWRCTMQRFKLSAETHSAAASFFCASHVRFPGVGDVSKTRSEAWEQFGAAWYGTATLRPRRYGVRPHKLI